MKEQDIVWMYWKRTLKISNIFAVSTDYLLKEEGEEESFTERENSGYDGDRVEEPVRDVFGSDSHCDSSCYYKRNAAFKI